ncbi:response regulator [Humisphaera borealis]|uniref:Response regulator n=1 Tax=Humisphaera borealis TaxID=2807512 RepID=A0A7M2WYS6_9BACT|nr:response regulator [Humisphaera borealis]QOV90001.1 response regulator [Humisphaera borealis]
MTDRSEYPSPAILLCDDSRQERLALARWLDSRAYQVHQADDGRSALQILRERRVDLVLLDLNMPRVDGFGVLEYLQEHRKALPVILLSGMPPERIQTGISRLTSHALPPLLFKPIDPDQLLSVVELALAGGLNVESTATDAPETHTSDHASDRAPR